MEVFHGTATECHLTYGITQCYLLPHTSSVVTNSSTYYLNTIANSQEFSLFKIVFQ